MVQKSVVSRGSLGLALLVPVGLLGCGSERYGRPPGPAPRYESAPLAPWTNGTTSEPGASGDDALESEIERALAADAGPAPGSEKDETPRGQ
jgi:hypothetical protein